MDEWSPCSYIEATEFIATAQFVSANQAFADLFGFENGRVTSSPFRALQGPQTDMSELQSAWSEVLDGVDKSKNFRLYHLSGECLPVKVKMQLIATRHGINDDVVELKIFTKSNFAISIKSAHTKAVCHPYIRSLSCRKSCINLLQSPVQQLLSRLAADLSPESLHDITRIVDRLVPKDSLTRAQADIARCKSLLRSTSSRYVSASGNQQDSNKISCWEERHQVRPVFPSSHFNQKINRRGSSTPASPVSSHGRRSTALLRRATLVESSLAGRNTPVIFLADQTQSPALLADSVALLADSGDRGRRAIAALRSALPAAVADAILDGRPLGAVTRPCVSVLFCDVVGFTALSAQMPAAHVAGLLRRLFAAFDALALRHGVQRVDVIGDCYVAAANFLEEQPADHAARLARFALDAVAAAAATPLRIGAGASCESVRVRIGMHCGPASAEVVCGQGHKYTMFGDTVNVASRMESSSLPGRVQCTAAMAALLAAQALGRGSVLQPRAGGVDAKGKGHLDTFWVVSVSDAESCGCGSRRRLSAPAYPDGPFPRSVRPHPHVGCRRSPAEIRTADSSSGPVQPRASKAPLPATARA